MSAVAELDSMSEHQLMPAAAARWPMLANVDSVGADVVNLRSQTTVDSAADFILLSAAAASEAVDGGEMNGFLAGSDSLIGNVDTRLFAYPGTLREVSWWEAAVKVTFYAILVCVSLIGNTFVVWTVYRNRTMRSPTTYYLVNLAVCDLMVTLLCIWVHLVVDLTEGWVFGAFFCKFSSFAQGGANYVLAAVNCRLHRPTLYTVVYARRSVCI